MNLTLAVDRNVVEKARRVAESMGKSLNGLIREYLEQVAGENDAQDDIEQMKRLSRKARGHSRGWKFDRDEIHERA